MTERDALLAAVLADPDADLPRLVFADWCDDHGEADRAELVRVQIELARRPAGDPARAGLEARADALLGDGHHRWKVPGVRGVQGFVRGFVEAWDGTADWFLAAAGPLFAAAPVREVRIRNADKAVPALCRLRELARVRTLDLSGNTLAAHDRLRRLLTETPLDRLRKLKLGNNRLFADALPQIAGSPVAPRLTALDLSGNPLGDEGFEAVAGLTELRRLKTLTLRCNELTDEDSAHLAGAKALAASHAFPRLTALDVSGHRLGDDGLLALLDSPLGRRLEVLRLAQNDLGANGSHRTEPSWGERLARADLPAVPRLLDLSGRRNTIHLTDAYALRDWPWLARGVTVDLRGCTTWAKQRDVLGESPHAAQLLLDPHPPADPT